MVLVQAPKASMKSNKLLAVHETIVRRHHRLGRKTTCWRNVGLGLQQAARPMLNAGIHRSVATSIEAPQAITPTRSTFPECPTHIRQGQSDNQTDRTIAATAKGRAGDVAANSWCTFVLRNRGGSNHADCTECIVDPSQQDDKNDGQATNTAT